MGFGGFFGGWGPAGFGGGNCGPEGQGGFGPGRSAHPVSVAVSAAPGSVRASGPGFALKRAAVGTAALAARRTGHG